MWNTKDMAIALTSEEGFFQKVKESAAGLPNMERYLPMKNGAISAIMSKIFAISIPNVICCGIWVHP